MSDMGLRPKTVQRNVRKHLLIVDESAIDGATAAQDAGLTGASSINEVNLTRNGDGDYSVAMVEAFQRPPVVHVTPLVADAIAYVESVTVSGFDVKITTNDGSTAKAADFNCTIEGFDSEDLI